MSGFPHFFEGSCNPISPKNISQTVGRMLTQAIIRSWYLIIVLNGPFAITLGVARKGNLQKIIDLLEESGYNTKTISPILVLTEKSTTEGILLKQDLYTQIPTWWNVNSDTANRTIFVRALTLQYVRNFIKKQQK